MFWKKLLNHIKIKALFFLIIVCIILCISLWYCKSNEIYLFYGINVENFLVGIFTNVIGIIIASLFIQSLINSHNESLLANENNKKILRRYSIVSIFINTYKEYLYIITTPSDKRDEHREINENFKITDLKDLYSPTCLIINNIIDPAILYYYKNEDLLVESMKMFLLEEDLSYNNDLYSCLYNFVTECKSNSTKDAILSYLDIKSNNKTISHNIVDVLSNNLSEEILKNYNEGKYYSNIMLPICIFYESLKRKIEILNKYESIIIDIRKQTY